MKQYFVGFHASPYELSKHPVVTAAAALWCNGYRLGNVAGDRTTSVVSRIFTVSNAHSLALPKGMTLLWVFWKTVVLSSKNRSPLHLHCSCAHNEQLYQFWYTFKSWSENWISEPGPLKNALLCILLEIAKEKICLGVKSAEFHLRHRVTPSQETQNQSNTHPLPLELSLQLLSQAFSRTGSTVLEHLHH